jgi:hypothetical protein
MMLLRFLCLLLLISAAETYLSEVVHSSCQWQSYRMANPSFHSALLAYADLCRCRPVGEDFQAIDSIGTGKSWSNFRIVPINSECHGWQMNVEGDSYGWGAKMLLFHSGWLPINSIVSIYTATPAVNPGYRRLLNLAVTGDWHELRLRAPSGNCIDIPGGNAYAGQEVRQWGCNGADAQRFEIVCHKTSLNMWEWASHCRISPAKDNNLVLAMNGWPGAINMINGRDAWNGGYMWKLCMG